MKIRTDFVTNSSSSSFVVATTLDFGDNKKMDFSIEDYDGDYMAKLTSVDSNSFGLSEEDVYDPNLDFDFPDIAVAKPVDISYAAKLKGEKLKQYLLDNLSVDIDLYIDDEDEEDTAYKDDEDSESEEFDAAKFINKCLKDKKALNEYLEEKLALYCKNDNTLKSIRQESTYGGRGEFMLSPFEIAERTFGSNFKNFAKLLPDMWSDKPKPSEDELFAELKKVECLNFYTDEALKNFIDWWYLNSFDYYEITVTEIFKDNKVDLYFHVD